MCERPGVHCVCGLDRLVQEWEALPQHPMPSGPSVPRCRVVVGEYFILPPYFLHVSSFMSCVNIPFENIHPLFLHQWPDWLGRSKKKGSKMLPFEEARARVRELGLINYPAWVGWVKSGKRPPNIPCEPHKVYRDAGWVSNSDFFGYEEPERSRDLDPPRGPRSRAPSRQAPARGYP